ncbi:hypothetical protein QLX08_002984 [Tetragonisca angustula]|uniref:Uncharacterized protein n=1 Tax=Tetragonisca angustula TaxID=166442 RepID=A0AAW1AAU2_9HYME
MKIKKKKKKRKIKKKHAKRDERDQTKISDHPLSLQRTSTDSLGVDESIALVASDQRYRDPLSITSDSIANHATKNQVLDDLAELYRGTVYFNYDRIRNDDYFPQGEEYEDEIGLDYGQMKRQSPNKEVFKEEQTDS